MFQVENSLLAPTLVFANIHNVNGRLANTKKMVSVPVALDDIENRIDALTPTSGSL